MNAIIHIICNGYQEFWLDGHEVEKVEKHWFDPRKYGASATITYKDGHTEEFESVIMVIVEHERDLCENIPADPKEIKNVLDEFNKEAQSAQGGYGFNVGDKVRIITDAWDMRGYVGQIVNFSEEKMIWAVQFPDGVPHCHNVHWYYHDDMKLSDENEREEFAKNLKIRIADLPLSFRALNVLKAADCETLEDIAKFSKRDFLKLRNAGKRSMGEITDLLSSYGLPWEYQGQTNFDI